MDLGAWLRSLGLERYEAAFLENEIDETVLPSLTPEDLRDIGVGPVGHRRKLLDAIAALRADGGANAPSANKSSPSNTSSLSAEDRAERRQVTVMFADLVGSTALSTRMDPEDLREVISAYQAASAEVIQTYGGLVAKYMGDGVLAYFGYPQAHEDDAERSVRAGLAVVRVVSGLKTRTQQSLQVRIGIATGLVVVGDVIGHGAAQEQAVVGETPNLAARLQSFAGPNSILIGPTTRRILGNLFEYRDLGRIEVKGFDAPVQAYQVLRPSSVVSRFEALRTTTTPLVGREEEIELLVRRWDRAKQGEGSVVLVCGEPGIGKSRLTQAVHDRLATEPHTRLRYFASPHHQDSALYPIISQLERATGLRRDDTDEQRLAKLETLLGEGTRDLGEAVPLLADLLSIPTGERYSPLNLTPQKRKERTLNALLAQVEGLAAKQPVLMVFEDVHWIDPTSREALDIITDRVAALRLLVIVTFRPEFSTPWVGRPQVTILTLNRLPARQRSDVIKGVVGGKAFPREIADQIVERTDGIPLFIEELTKAVIESGVVAEAGDHYEVTGALTPLTIPTSLHASLLARLDRLAPVSDVAQIAAALGRSFSHELISAVAGMPGQKLDDALDQLVAAELIFRRGFPPDAEYTFKHALVQDTAYGTLLKSRRQQIHGRIAAILEEKFSEIVATQPALLAHHFTEAGVIDKAVGYWLQAGTHAISRSAMTEAVAQLRKGLELLGTASDSTERQQRELAFQTELGRALTATKGYAAPETGQAYEQARALSMRLGDTASFVRAGYGQFLYLLIRGEVKQATEVAHDILAAARKTKNEDVKILGYRLLGVSLFESGQLENGRKNLEISGELLQRQNGMLTGGRDARVMIPTWLINIIMYQGYADQAGQVCRLSLAEARTSSMMHSRMFAECFAVNLLVMRRDYQQALASADAVCTMATDLNFPFFLACGLLFRGISQAHLGDLEGIKTLHDGISLYKSTGARWALPYWLTEIASVPGQKLEVARATLADASATAEETGEVWNAAELSRVAGDLALAGDWVDATEVEKHYQTAKSIAKRQGAKLLELRAATRLARLWGDRGKRTEARDLLAPVYNWFTEGFDTLELNEAKALLTELA